MKNEFLFLGFVVICFVAGVLWVITVAQYHFMQWFIPGILAVIAVFTYELFERMLIKETKEQIEHKCRQEVFQEELRHAHTILELRRAIDSIYEEYKGNDLIEKDDIMNKLEQIINDYYE